MSGPRGDAVQHGEKALLDVRGLTVSYAGRRRGVAGHATAHVAVQDIDLTLSTTGRTLGLVGESGSGKTSAIRAISGRITPLRGTVEIYGRDVHAMSRVERAAAFQFIPQDSRGSLDPRRSARWSVAEPLVIAGTSMAQAQELAAQLLVTCGLSERQHRRRPHELSGGEVKRVCIARALVRQPGLVIADEPTAGLDVTVQAQVLGLLQKLQASRNLSMLIITHDIGVVRQLATDVAVMYQGRIVESGPVDRVLDDPQHDYTRRLIATVPSFSRVDGGHGE